MPKLISAVVLLALAVGLPAFADSTRVRVVEIDGAITVVTRMLVDEALDAAAEEGDDLVLLTLDTPGGILTSTEDIIKSVLASEVPVVAWVGPSGAHAASAGFYILLACDVAAMAPGTRTGAASVVTMGGENREDDVMLKKVTQDAAALVRSIAERRGRDVEAAERAVLDAVAFTETDALEAGLIDIVSSSVDAFLASLDGREIVRFDGARVVLSITDPQLEVVELDLRGKIMGVLATPQVAFLLFMLGMLGLYVEFTHPGLVFPGVAGALCLVLFAMSAQVLPISTVGILLILLAIVMFVLEIKVTSYGMLTVGGLVALVLGSMMLVDGPIPELRVPPSVVWPTAAVVGGFVILALYFVRRAQQARVATGEEGLVGQVGAVRIDLDPEGTVFVRGELWNAVSRSGTLAVGTRVRVIGVAGMVLEVEPQRREGES